ncbi:MAG: HEAT repeat domain-containing protein [Deltaproteobacteria bacterium]
MRGQRTTTTIAQVALGLIMAAHQASETARDALFLAKLGPTELPTVYLILAAIGIPVAMLPHTKRRPLTAGLLWLFAPITVSFAWTITMSPHASRALYVWTGLSTTIVVTFFWRSLADRYDIPHAKSAFPRIALGGIVGAALGALGARGLVEYFDTRFLLAGAGVLWAIAGGVTWWLQRRLGERTDAARDADDEPRPRSRLDDLRQAFGSKYVRSVGVLLVIASMTFTSLDYTFKAVVANQVDVAKLASSFATFYLVLNVVALVTQVVLAKRVLHRIGLGTLVLFLPSLIVLGSVGVIIGGGAIAALALKGIDGSLRHSLHRTSTELLFVPMSSNDRSVTKPIFDIVGKRGGQALGSLLILAFLLISKDTTVFASITAGLAAIWFAGGVLVRKRYLDVFRSALRDRAAFPADLPELGLTELSTMLEALNSDAEGEVIGAIDVLEAHGQIATVPDLILYHPSPEVLIRALTAFRAQGRRRVRRLAVRLLGHERADVRAEALLTLAAMSEAAPHLERARADVDPVVRGIATALTWTPDEVEWFEVFDGRTTPETRAVQVGVARAFRYLQDSIRDRLTVEHFEAASAEAQRALAEALAERPKTRDVPIHIASLAFRGPREHARAALVAIGQPALDACIEALRASDTDLSIRVHLPRTLSLFDPVKVAPILATSIVDETDELVRHKALRGLGRLVVTHPGLPLHEDRLVAACERELRWTFRMIAVRRVLETIDDVPPTTTAIHEALLALLAESERRGIEHIFRLLHLMNPEPDLETMFHSVMSADDRQRIGARELLTDLVELRFRAAVLALVSDDDDDIRLEAGAEWLGRPVHDLSDALDELAGVRGPLEQAASRYREVLDATLRQPEVA